MSGPARAGALLYVKALDTLSLFYQQLLGMQVLHADAMHHVIASPDLQLLLHAIPPHIAATITITTPPAIRDEQAIKLFFTVPSLSAAEAIAVALGGGAVGGAVGVDYEGPGFTVRNLFDPEGNILQVRAAAP